MTVNAQLPAIEALIAACEASVAQLRLQAPPLDLIENARDELEAYRRMSRLLRTLGARQRRRSRICAPS